MEQADAILDDCSIDKAAAIASSCSGHDRLRDATLMVMAILLLVGIGALMQAEMRTRLATPNAPALKTIDPNYAPWWELSLLPRLGPTTAQAILDYRRDLGGGSESREPIFGRVSDLVHVKGIGPRIIARFYPHIRVEEP